jgi:hypothetical protein
MKVRWRKLILQIAFWAIAEIVLNLIGLDDLADYGEFVFTNKETVINYYQA